MKVEDGSLKIQYSRSRYYDYYTGRWLTHDPLGITPNPQKPNVFEVTTQYKDGMSLYEYVQSNSITSTDSHGLKPVCCKIREAHTYVYCDPLHPWSAPVILEATAGEETTLP